jgi:hypothetical protein
MSPSVSVCPNYAITDFVCQSSLGYLQYGLIKAPPVPAARAAVREVIATTLGDARRALRVLEMTAARYSKTLLPSHIAIDREDKRDEIAGLEKRLAELGAIT